jgi:hypothetical protein
VEFEDVTVQNWGIESIHMVTSIVNMDKANELVVWVLWVDRVNRNCGELEGDEVRKSVAEIRQWQG